MEIIKCPLTTEKSIKLMESENKLVFIINSKSTKIDVKKAIEEMFKVKVLKVNIATRGVEKRAFVKFAASTPAIDIATELGLM